MTSPFPAPWQSERISRGAPRGASDEELREEVEGDRMDEVGHDALRVDPQVEAPPGSFLVPKSEERVKAEGIAYNSKMVYVQMVAVRMQG